MRAGANVNILELDCDILAKLHATLKMKARRALYSGVLHIRVRIGLDAKSHAGKNFKIFSVIYIIKYLGHERGRKDFIRQECFVRTIGKYHLETKHQLACIWSGK